MLGFRVWDSKDKIMFYHQYFGTIIRNTDLDSEFENRLIPCFAIKGDGSLSMWNHEGLEPVEERYTPMQSTGLRDANDVEIFEEDIILMEYPTTKKTDPDLYHVKSVSSFFIILGAWNKYGGVLKISKLGNSMENPELLEKSKC